jgi:glycosyltransferase involved in cell wall biosynthesis
MNKTGTICLFNSNTTWGGGEKWIQETGITLSDNKYYIVVCTNSISELYNNLTNTSLKILPVKIVNLSYLNPLKIFSLYRIFRKLRVDIIVLGLSQDLKAAGLAAKLAGVRQIIYRRGLANPIKNNLVNQFYFRRIVTKVIANSEEVKRSLLVRNSFLIDSADVHVIYNGINLADVTNHNRKINGSPVIIGNVGRLIEGKGQKYLIDLAANLKEHQYNFLIKIVGIGKMRHQLEDYAKKLKVDDSIIFVEFLNDTRDFYQEIDIFVFPSGSEGCSNAILEAMAYEKPVVAFNISSMPEMIDDGLTGFLVPYKDVKAMTEKVALLINNASRRREMGEQARLKISTKFDFTKNLKLLEELF